MTYLLNGERLTVGKTIVVDGIKHPYQILSAWSEAELNSIGITKSPPPEIPVDEYRAAMKKQVDHQAEEIRLKYITAGSGMAITYREKLEQAEQALSQGQAAIDALSSEEEVAAYPTLAASVGIEAQTLWECAHLVMTKYQQWAALSHSIEVVRLSAKKQLNDAVSLEAVQAAYSAIDWGDL